MEGLVDWLILVPLIVTVMVSSSVVHRIGQVRTLSAVSYLARRSYSTALGKLAVDDSTP